MTATLIASPASATQADTGTNDLTALVAEYREQAKAQLADAEPGNFVTYSEDCVQRPGMKDLWYSLEYGWQDPESSGVPICFKRDDGRIVFGVFVVTGIERPNRPAQPLTGEAQPPRCWFVKGSFILDQGPRLNVRGKFSPHTFSGEVVVCRDNL